MTTDAELQWKTIRFLTGIQCVRKRPGMYIGDTEDGTGLHNLVFEAVNGALYQVLLNGGGRITVTLHADASVTIADDGPGLPLDVDPRWGGVAAAQAALTKLLPGRFGLGTGLGLAAVNALCDELQLSIFREGRIHQQEYRRAEPVAPLSATGVTQAHGTVLHCRPSPEIFGNIQLDYKVLARRLRELAAFNAGVRIELNDERRERAEVFEHTLAGLVLHLGRHHTAVHDTVLVLHAQEGAIRVELALQWNEGREAVLQGYTNHLHQPEGGTHLEGLKFALTRTLSAFIHQLRPAGQAPVLITEADVLAGLTAIVSVRMPAPELTWTRGGVQSREVTSVVDTAVSALLQEFLAQHPEQMQKILARITRAARAREAARGWR